MNELEKTLSKFDSIALKEMDSVRLMNRTDTKYIFRVERLSSFLNEITDDYKILEIEGNRINSYETVYFDTENFQMYMNHQNGKTNRYKVRFRTYIESKLNYFEIKFKNNKKKTFKQRVKLQDDKTQITNKAEDFLHEKTHYKSDELFPKLWVNYSRITLVNKTFPERLTIDLKLQFRNGIKQEQLHDIVIAELKQGKRTVTSFVEVMNKHRIRKSSISKYCFGIIFLFENIKKNNFKPKLLNLNKIRYGTI
jgi:hypothetical protein